MIKEPLAQLQKVDLRKVWKSEPGDFRPWLADPGGLKLLGDAIGVDLELEAQEKDVGPFRADILCKDIADNTWVLIENQLETTDHTHLGQLLTYAAGLDAVTIIWIAKRFTDEHRATLDWLNEVTGKNINIFGLEVELWRIGNSPIAPKFNIVAKPNEWTKGGIREELTPAKQLQLEFWTAFREYVLNQGSVIKPTKALPQHWMNISIGRSYFGMHSFVDTTKPRMGVRLFITGLDAKAHFELLRQQRVNIEKEIGEELSWEKKPSKKESCVGLHDTTRNCQDREQWPEQQSFLLDVLERFYRAFAERIKKLDAGDYQPDSTTND